MAKKKHKVGLNCSNGLNDDLAKEIVQYAIQCYEFKEVKFIVANLIITGIILVCQHLNA